METNTDKKRPFGCKCETLSEHILGDGCDECNKALVIEMLSDERDELTNEVAKTPIKLSKRPYYYECGDGCCTEWGETWYVDGVDVCSGPCENNRLQQLLCHLGFDARIVNENEDGEEVCEFVDFRTRRQLPNDSESPKSSKQEEMPLDVIEKSALEMISHGSVFACLRYLRDEIQKLKEAK